MATDERDGNREVEALLHRLDHEPPRITAEQVIALARAGRSRPLRRAAGVVLVLAGAGVAYAVPGSPLPGWIEGIAGGRSATLAPLTPALPSPADIRQVSGVEIAEPVTSVIIRTRGEGGFLRVLLSDGERLVARAPEGAARFGSEPDRLVIDVIGADTVELLLPRSAPLLEVSADGRVLLRKHGDELRASTRGTAGAYLFPLRP